jgi:hypothetical protein
VRGDWDVDVSLHDRGKKRKKKLISEIKKTRLIRGECSLSEQRRRGRWCFAAGLECIPLLVAVKRLNKINLFFNFAGHRIRDERT